MNRNKTLLSVKPNRKRWMAPTALALAAIMGVTTVITTPVYAANTTTVSTEADSDTSDSSSSSSSSKDSTVTKDETVYVVADAKGNKKTVTVSDQLKGAGEESTVQDSSTLSDIQNTKGDETYTGSGDSMTWKTDGEDIYYQGKSDAELPVGVNFTYYLDGEEIEPQDLVGKSGKLTIDIEYTNDTETTLTVDGKEQTTKVPFVMMTGMFMPSEKFSNITIDNGKIIDNGSKSIVIGFGMPGLSDALDLEYVKNKARNLDSDNLGNLDDATIPESVEITADVEDFELDSTYTIATSDVFSDVDMSDITSLSDIDSKVDELEDATLKLVDGSKELSDGTEKLNKSYADLDNGIADLKTGIKAYTDGVASAKTGSDQLASGASSLSSGLVTYTNGVSSAKAGADQLASGASSLNSGLSELTKNNDALNAGAKSLDDGINQLNAGAAALQTGATAYTAGVDQSASGAANLAYSMDLINQGYGSGSDFANGMNGLSTVASNLASSASSFSSGLTYFQSSANTKLDDDQKQTLSYLVNVANQLSSGAEDLSRNATKINVAVNGYDAADGHHSGLVDNLSDIDKGVNSLNSGLQTASKSSQSIRDGVYSVQSGVQQLSAGSTSLKSGLATYTGGVSSAAQGAAQISTGISSLQSGLNTLNANSSTLTNGAAQLSSGATTLAAGMNTLNSNSPTLNSGATKLKSGSTQVKDGISDLNTGAKTLSDGMSQYNDEAIQPIVSNLNSLSGTVDRMDALKNGDLSYDNFSGISDDMDGTVKFVITTESIKAATD